MYIVRATTKGTGPFRPAIVILDGGVMAAGVYVLPQEYDSEDMAHEIAQRACDQAWRVARAIVEDEGFVREKE
jgi:hypothetical protein